MTYDYMLSEDEGRFFVEVYDVTHGPITDDQTPVYVTGFYDREVEAEEDAASWEMMQEAPEEGATE